MTEVAIVNVKTGQVAVNVVFRSCAFVKNKTRRVFQRYDTLFPEGSVSEAHTFEELVQQIDDAGFQPTDVFVEYSMRRVGNCLDIGILNRFLTKKGREGIWVKEAYPVCKFLKDYLGQVLNIPSWAQQILFRALFPQSPLTDNNHVALIDTMQLAQIFRLIAELSKPASNRTLPEGLLEGLHDLPPARLGDPTQSTLAAWLKSGEDSCEPVDARQETNSKDISIYQEQLKVF
ncbi:hypothetical protein B7463_g9080, partial [Scytalidium lignicola]